MVEEAGSYCVFWLYYIVGKVVLIDCEPEPSRDLICIHASVRALHLAL